MTEPEFQFRLLQQRIDDEIQKEPIDKRDIVFWTYFIVTGLFMAYLIYQTYQYNNLAIEFRDKYLDCYNQCKVIIDLR